jgi:diguanylate cyclase (GGDEF)-like protein
MRRHRGSLEAPSSAEELPSPQCRELPHEFGGRLTVIEGFAEMLVDGLGSISVESARQLAEVIARDAGRVRELLGRERPSIPLDRDAGDDELPVPLELASQERPVFNRPTVLVVDDDHALRALVRFHLQGQGCNVRCAVDGEDALSSCHRTPPDVIVLDVHLPGLDGWEVMGRLKADPRLCHIPVILLTGRRATSDVVDGLARGAHDYLAKPFVPVELCARVEAALRVKRLTDELRRRNDVLGHDSRTDWLTGLPNRRHVEERLSELTSAARRHHQSLAVVMLDIDDFKTVNDEFGHSAGDAVLRGVALSLRSMLRAYDMAGRWGGDEFAILLPFTDLRRSQAVAGRLRAAVAKAPIDLGGGRWHRVLVSVGCGAGVGTRVDAHVLVDTADQALYAAKRAGVHAVVPAAELMVGS